MKAILQHSLPAESCTAYAQGLDSLVKCKCLPPSYGGVSSNTMLKSLFAAAAKSNTYHPGIMLLDEMHTA